MHAGPAVAPRDRHVVQIYREAGFLQRAVGAWIGEAIRAGGSGILVCSGPNAARVRRQLAQDGLDVPALERAERLQVVDSDGLMSRFMVNGLPDGGRFGPLVGALVDTARRAARSTAAPVRAWGEMVNALAERGDMPAARALEDLWNDAIARTGIELLCSYRLDNLDTGTQARLLRDVCHGHSRLLPEEDEAHFERALSRSLVRLVGPVEAARLWDRFATRPPISIRMPAAEAVLVGIHASDPALGERVLAALREELPPPRST